MRSMTGFGQATGSNARHALTVALRSVNARYLEIRLRLDDEHQTAEAELKSLLEGELSRGRVSVSVDVQVLGERPVEVRVHRPAVEAAHAALEELVEGGLIGEKLTAGDLLRMPEALEVRALPDRWDDADRELLLEVAGEALEQLVAGRAGEGERLRQVLAARLESLGEAVRGLRELAGGAVGAAAAALKERLDELLAGEGPGRGVDPERLEQEVAILADRLDVSEELDRLDAHLEHFRELLGRDGAVGKRLDFLAQEILRELNTAGSKCRHAAMTRKVLDGKVLCEQIREQVQNVE